MRRKPARTTKDFKKPVDLMFERLEEKKTGTICRVKQYKVQTCGKTTAKSINFPAAQVAC